MTRAVDQHMFAGTARVFLSEALFLPTGLVTAAYLTRTLGPSLYGIFTLATIIVAWVEWTIASIFARATFKFVAEAEDWRPVAISLIRVHVVVSCLAALTLWLISIPIASILREPALAGYVALFAIDIPLFALAQVVRNILIGLGRFRQRAWVSAGKWIARMVFIVVLLELGFSVKGAIAGNILASVIELMIAWMYLRPPILQRSNFPVARFWNYALPLFLFAISMRIYEKLDLIALKALGGSASDAGIYGAAQNLSIVASIFSMSFAPLLLSTLSAALPRDELEAKATARKAMQLVLALIPFAAVAAEASVEIVTFFFGAFFKPSAPILSFLIFSGVALTMISVTTAILTAIGKPGLTFALSGPLVPLSILGYAVVIPQFGSVGVAAVNCLLAVVGAAVTVVVVQKYFRTRPPLGTLLRSVALSALVYFAAGYWPAAGALVIFKLTVLSIAIIFGFVLLGEVKPGDLIGLVFLREQRSNVQ